MKKYFIVTKPDIIENYAALLKYEEEQRVMFREFAERYGIEANEFYTDEKQFMIVPTEKDYEKFQGELVKAPFIPNELIKFKERSVIGKDWKKRAAEEKLKTVHKPVLLWDLNGTDLNGRSKENLFEINGVLYASFELQHDFDLEPGQVIEIKASEFYKIVEDHNARHEAEE